MPPRRVMTLGLDVHLRDQRTGCVQIEEFAALGFGRHRFRHTMRGEDYTGAIRRLIQLVDEDRAEAFQPLDDRTVVHDLVAHVDRRAILLEREFDDSDRPLDTGTEAARACEKQLQLRLLRLWLVWREAFHDKPAWLQSGVLERLFEKSAAAYKKSSERQKNGDVRCRGQNRA